MDFAVHFYIAKDKEGNMGFFKDVRDDIKAVLDRDPAARNGFEVLVCYLVDYFSPARTLAVPS